MLSPRALGRFFGPYLTFAAISGLAGGFILGAIVTIIGFIGGVVTLVGGIAGGTALQSATHVLRAFPVFAFLVLLAAIYGFAGAFIAGLIAALVGGFAGFWWSFLAMIGTACFIYPHYFRGHHGPDPYVPMALIISVLGVLIAMLYLSRATHKMPLATSIGRFLAESWLASPSQRARFAGLLLPMVLYSAWEIKTVWPEFSTHPNYAARIGNWATWQNSKRIALSRHSIRRDNCQSNLKQIGLGLLQYMQDYDELYPPLPKTAQDGTGAVIFPYVRSTQLFQCPQELYSPRNPKFSSGDFTDYWFNARFYSLNQQKVTSPAQSIIFGDGNTGAGEANAAYSLKSVPPNWAPSMRHNGVANYAFADGHVKALKGGSVSNTAAPTAGGYTMIP